MPFENEIYLSKDHGSYMAMGVYLQNLKSGCLFFLATSGGRCPLKMKYTCPVTLGHVVSEYIWLWWSMSNLYPAPSEGRCPLEIKYTYPITLGHVVLEYTWLWDFISKTLGMVACFVLHL